MPTSIFVPDGVGCVPNLLVATHCQTESGQFIALVSKFVYSTGIMIQRGRGGGGSGSSSGSNNSNKKDNNNNNHSNNNSTSIKLWSGLYTKHSRV